ncbi:MAG: M4 family metallopeptidase [Candidatus Thorarchaeota archaeon]
MVSYDKRETFKDDNITLTNTIKCISFLKKLSELLLLVFLICTLIKTEIVLAQNINAINNEIEKLHQNLIDKNGNLIEDYSSLKERSRISFHKGRVRYLGASPNHYFRAIRIQSNDPEIIGKEFLKEQPILFGIKSEKIDFKTIKLKTRIERSNLRLQQTYADIPVFSGEINVQINNINQGIECVLSDILTNTDLLDSGMISIIPTISKSRAQEIVTEKVNLDFGILNALASEPLLKIYDPEIVGNIGNIQLVWEIYVSSQEGFFINELILVNAHNGEIALQYSNICSALNREVYDANNSDADPGNLERSEGDQPSNITDVNTVYDYLEDTYSYYLIEHNRDSGDNNGNTISATVRYCRPGSNCPWYNAMMSGNLLFGYRLYFGEGYTADDVVAHEYTHWITIHESSLNYINQSGAINEAFSDIWGEFVDLSNGSGNDNNNVRWLHGEDLPFGYSRNMSNPPDPNCSNYLDAEWVNMPDRMGSPNFYNGDDDQGGVHHNCGVGNKLCYLLVDGANFNGYTISPFGISKTADLFYEVQTNLLTSGADYWDLYNALTQAAINLDWTISERENLENACRAVEIHHGIIEIHTDNLIVNNWGQVFVDVIAPEEDEFYIKVWDDTGILPPAWQWPTTSSNAAFLSLAQNYTFPFDVMPTSTSETFEFWLYQNLALALYWPIQRVEVRLNASPEESDQIPPFITDYNYNSYPETDILITFNENINTSTINSTNVSLLGSLSGNHMYAFNFDQDTYTLIIDPDIDFSYGETVTVTLGTGIQDLAGNGLDGDGNGTVGPAFQFSFTINESPPPPHSSILITENLNPPTCDPNDVIQVSGRVSYDNNDPVINGTVQIQYDWDGSWHTWTASTDNVGDYNRVINAPGSEGNYPIYVEASDGNLTGTNSQTLIVRSGDSGDNYYFAQSLTCKDVDANYNPLNPTKYFRGDDIIVYTWVHLEDVYVNNNSPLITVRWEYYQPNGTLYGSDTYTIPDPGSGYYLDYYTWYGYYISGYSMSDIEGRWNCKIYIDEGNGYEFIQDNEFTIRYEFDEHRMCKDVAETSPYDPIDLTNIFDANDTRAITWARFNNVVDGLEVRWDFYQPDGTLYSSFELDEPIEDPGVGNYLGWAKVWGWIWINGYSAQYMCGNWSVRVFVRDAFDNWEQQYADNFRIQENISPSASVSMIPSSPIETQSITLNISSSDNNHLDRVTLHWNDGSAHSNSWTSINASAFSQSYNIGSNYIAGQQIEYWVEVWDESGNHTESQHRLVIISPEVVTIPNQPIGSQYLQVNEVATYSTSGATTNLGHIVEYQFEWGDGQLGNWGANNQSHNWINEDLFYIRARARCQLHTNRISDWSDPLNVIVDSTNPQISISTNNGEDFTTNEQQLLLSGFAYDPEPSSGLNTVFINTDVPNSNTMSNWSFPITLNEGNNVFIITAEDNSGNSGSDTIIVNRIIPQRPVLSWTGETSFENDGVNPDTGYTNTNFEFRIIYSDEDNDAPALGFPRIHINKGEIPITGSPFIMTEVNSEPFISGRIYSLSINTFEEGSDYSYQFEAQDLNGANAAGEGTIEQSGPVVLNQDRIALEALYNSTDGPNWINNTNWLTDEPLETWYGLMVSNNRVIRIELYQNNLSGSIPIEIGLLTNLENLNLSSNNLYGSIPSQIDNLENLQNLALDYNNLSGTIPTELGNLINLEIMGLSYNNLTGTIPSDIGNLDNLRYLTLTNNDLSGQIPVEIYNLINLESLVLESNTFSGILSSEIGNLVHLQILGLMENDISGQIPSEIFNLISLEHLNLGANNFEGSISSQFGNLLNLGFLNLQENNFTGEIPSEIYTLVNLENLNLGSNNLSGVVSSEIGNLVNLQFLSLYSNNFSGAIPDEMTNINNLQTFYLSSNQFNELPNLSSNSLLTTLQIHNNRFTFEDIEPNINIASFMYHPQANVLTEIDTIISEGETIELNSLVGGTANQYQWFKDGNIISDANSSAYLINSADPDDSGVYICEVTNTIATNLTLYREPINLNVVQTQIPNLSWTGETYYENDGVNPDTGFTDAVFTYRILYADEDNDAPLSGYPVLHINKGGNPITNSPFTMIENNNDPFTTGRIYSFSINNLEEGSDYTYQFEAQDMNGADAIGEGTVEQPGPVVEEEIIIYNITITTEPEGLTIIVDNGQFIAPYTFPWQPGSGHTIGVDSPQFDGDSIRYVFDRWSDQGTQIHHITTPENNSTFTVYFNTEYFLTMHAGTGGTVQPESGWQRAEDEIEISAMADNDYFFIDWIGLGNGSYTGTNSDTMITMNEPISQMANFGQFRNITISTLPESLLILVDSTQYKSPKKFKLKPDSIHTICVYSPQFGEEGVRYLYHNWNDDGDTCHTIIIPDEDSTYIASFITQYYLSVDKGFPDSMFLPIIKTYGEDWYMANDSAEFWIFPDTLDTVITGERYIQVFKGWDPQVPGYLEHANRVKILMDYPKSEMAIWDDIAITNLSLLDMKFPKEFVLFQNYPNPFNPITTIKYGIPKPSQVSIEIYNLLGQKVVTLINKKQETGYHKIEFKADRLSTGIYFYVIRAENFYDIKKMLLVK